MRLNMPLPHDAFSEQSDEALLAAYGKGDGAAARALTARLCPRMLGYAQRMLHDQFEAEDVVQEAMLRLWKIAPEWRVGEARVTTWLFRVVTNLCTDRLRSRGGGRRTVGLDGVAEPADPARPALAGLAQAERLAALNEALSRLPARQRQAVVLRHIEGLSNPEIGAVMGIGTEAVESLTARGKRGLSNILAGRREELGYEDD